MASWWEDEEIKASKRERLIAGTTMLKPYLPRETLDHIIDLLRDEQETLKQCCLVSKSWVPRTRKHLFAYIQLRSASNLESWKKTFPDVANSPACHACELLIGCPWLVVAADVEEGGWIRAFSGVTSFGIHGGKRRSAPTRTCLSPQFLTRPRVSPRGSQHLPIPTTFRPHSFISPP